MVFEEIYVLFGIVIFILFQVCCLLSDGEMFNVVISFLCDLLYCDYDNFMGVFYK